LQRLFRPFLLTFLNKRRARQAVQRCRRILALVSAAPQLGHVTIVAGRPPFVPPVWVLRRAESCRAHSLEAFPAGAAAYSAFSLLTTSAPSTFWSVPSHGKSRFNSVLVILPPELAVICQGHKQDPGACQDVG